MPQFHETGYGKKFFEMQLPMLTRAIEDLSKNVEKIAPQEIQRIEVPIGLGTLIAEPSSDPDYPGIWITLRSTNGIEQNVTLVESNEDIGLRTLCWRNSEEDYISATRWDKK